jgi:hypothetical protein
MLVLVSLTLFMIGVFVATSGIIYSSMRAFFSGLTLVVLSFSTLIYSVVYWFFTGN